jgi:MtrB/PioB family decaheme-associated outer membrane protein
MRIRILSVIGTCLVLCAASTAAQTTTPPGQPAVATALPAVTIGEVDFGVRLNTVSGDPARFQRLRDLRTGPTVDRLRYVRDTDTWQAQAQIDHAGFRDQRYYVGFNRYGRVRGSFEFNQVPLFFSTDTRTPYRTELDAVLRLDDTLQAAVQNGAAITTFEQDMRPFDLRSRRDVADLRFAYSATRDLDLQLSMTSTAREGGQPWGASFGFSNAIAVAVPVEHRTNDLRAAAEWSNERGMARLAYDGSWFDNSAETLIWDNPLRFTDQTHASAYSAGNASSQGRMALWPDSTAHTVSASGSLALPRRSRAFGYVSVGSWLQDQALLPHTINTAIAPIPLARDTADAEARIVSMNYRVTSRPTSLVWLSGQFRLYDYDNQTPHFPVNQYVRLDGNTATSITGGSEPFGYTRHFIDLDASFTPLRFVAFRAGYGRERDDRTFRFLEETTEHTLRASIDSTALMWGSLRLQYEHSERTGDGLDEQVLSDIGEQVSLRQFDISDRNRDRVTAIVQVVPMDSVGFNGSLAVGREHRPDAAFGLQDNDLRSFTVGIDLTPRDDVTFGATYGFENYSTLQRSRQANPGPQFEDPTRDWSTDMDEGVHTISANVDLPQVMPRTAVALVYDYVRSNAQYLYLLPPNSTLTPPQQLPPVRNEVHRAGIDLRRTLTGNTALGVGYAFDRYDVQDFAQSPATLNTAVLPAFLNLVYQWRPYTAHTGSVRLIYRW